MKRILAFLVILIIAVIALVKINPPFVDNLLTFSYCDRPLHYRVDTVDPQFNLSRDDFLADINQAVQIWTQGYGKNLFIYDPQGSLSINMIFDERQSITAEIKQQEQDLKSEKKVLNPKLAEYNRLSADLKQKVDNLNQKVEYWNSKGGAPPEEYQKIIKQQEELKTIETNLNSMARNLNISADQFNSQVNRLNEEVDIFNSLLEERPEEGVFNGPENKIEIYFNINKPELIHTLAHELGHALGIEHVSDPKSIMYAKTTQRLALTEDDTEALESICRKRSIFEPIQVRLSKLISNLSPQP